MSKEKKLKVKLISKSKNLYDDEMVNYHKCKANFVAEGIHLDYESWQKSNPIFISAQTGMGKNTFIEKVFLSFVLETRNKILIVSNRIANNRQQKERMANIVGCKHYLEDLTAVGLDKTEIFANVRIVTYQKLGSYLSDIFECQKLKDTYDIVVYDEVHYFCSDALFNNQTGVILKNSLLTFKNSLRIYMTSTPEEIFPVILQNEKSLGNTTTSSLCYINYGNNAIIKPKELLLYDFRRDYSYIKPKYFNSKNEIIELIKNDMSQSKWLVFVTNKKDGEEFVRQIGNDTVFITANSKKSKNRDGEIYAEIVTQEKFSCKVLVSTSVMDNGINFKDDILRNIVLFTSDRTEFIQMLGRKRRTDNENLNLYICARDSLYFNAKLYNLKQQIQAICCFKSNRSSFAKQYSIGSVSGVELFKGLFYFDDNLNICINELAEIKIYTDKLFYESIISELNDGIKEAFINKQLSWIGLEKTYNPCSWVSYVDSDKNKAVFFKFLEYYCDTDLSDKDFYSFGVKFKELANIAYGKQPGDRPDRNYKEVKMRSFFKRYNLDYDIAVKNKVYTLRKIT